MLEKNNVSNNSKFKKQSDPWKGLTISYAAVKQIKNLMKKNIGMIGLRIDIKKHGCAGFGYSLEPVIKLHKTDIIYEQNEIKLFITPKAMPIIDGTTLDYIQNNLKCEFKFHNPQAKYSCGCGESFSI